MNFALQLLEKKTNENEFESYYEAQSQTKMSGKKHTVTKETMEIIQRKLIRKSLSNSIENSLSRRKENRRGPDESKGLPRHHS